MQKQTKMRDEEGQGVGGDFVKLIFFYLSLRRLRIHFGKDVKIAVLSFNVIRYDVIINVLSFDVIRCDIIIVHRRNQKVRRKGSFCNTSCVTF